MDNEFRRLILAMAAAMAIFIGWRYMVTVFSPEQDQRPPAPTEQVPAAPTQPTTGPAVIDASKAAPTPTTGTATGPVLTAAPGAALLPAEPDERIEPVVLGGEEGDMLRVELHPRGGSVTRLELFRKNDKGEFVHQAEPDSGTPYPLLTPVSDGVVEEYSFATHRVWIKEYGNEAVSLAQQVWELVDDAGPDTVAFQTTLSDTDGNELLRFRKTYALHEGQPVFDLDLTVENLSGRPLTIRLAQDGPIGIRKEHLVYDMRFLLTAQRDGDSISLNKAHTRDGLRKATVAGEPESLLEPAKGPLLWTCLTNKYFGVFTRPLPPPGERSEFVASLAGLVANPPAEENLGDLLARATTVPTELAPGASTRFPFEIYAGPKDATYLKKINPAYADHTKLYYQLAQSADGRCCAFCAPIWLREMMVWLLETIHSVVRNYGVAIIILVIIIRGLLHPLTVFQQKSMFRMQENMARIQPKLSAVKEKYANDKVKQNQEMMKLFSEEGINPAANFVAFIPLFLQMPILIALWTALNTDVNLRHAPFDGWWIQDLSAPDAFIRFAEPYDVPILSSIPLLNMVFAGVTSINLLPILMGISMWLQQKYMPKPHMQAKLDAAKKQDGEQKKPAGGMSPEDQLRQQQMVAYMMAIMFPLMFYNMPAGLNLYWMATNVVGICESLIIRRQLAHEKERREKAGPAPPRRPGKKGIVGRFFERIAKQAEDLQRKADDLAKQEERKRAEQRAAKKNDKRKR